jgi:hypothetical protein
VAVYVLGATALTPEVVAVLGVVVVGFGVVELVVAVLDVVVVGFGVVELTGVVLKVDLTPAVDEYDGFGKVEVFDVPTEEVDEPVVVAFRNGDDATIDDEDDVDVVVGVRFCFAALSSSIFFL